MRIFLIFVFLLWIGVTNAHRIREELNEYKHGHGHHGHQGSNHHHEVHGGGNHHHHYSHEGDVSIPGSSLVSVPDIGGYSSNKNCKAPNNNTQMKFSVGKKFIITSKPSKDDFIFTINLIDKNGNSILFYKIQPYNVKPYACTLKKNHACTDGHLQYGPKPNIKEGTPITVEIKIKKTAYEIYMNGQLSINFPHYWALEDVQKMAICSWRRSKTGFIDIENVSLLHS